MKYLLMILIMFGFSACELFEDTLAKKEKIELIELKKLEAQQKKEIAVLENKKSLATIEKDKLIELQKLQNEMKTKEMSSNAEARLEAIRQQVILQENNNDLSFKTYLLIFLAFALTVISILVFFYFKRKRENELRAYEDNLKKYFHHKENETKLKIASQILETIKEGNLSQDNEKKLINAFSKEQDDFEEDAEIINAIEHKDKDDI